MKKIIATGAIVGALVAGSAGVATADTGSSARDSVNSSAPASKKPSGKQLVIGNPIVNFFNLFHKSPSVGRSGR